MRNAESRNNTHNKRSDQHKDWSKRRYEYLAKVPWEEVFVEKYVYSDHEDLDWSFDAEVKNDGVTCKKCEIIRRAEQRPLQKAPKKGWVLITGPVWPPGETQPAAGPRLGAPELGDTAKEPYNGPLLSFPSPNVYALTLADAYFVVSAVHDAERQVVGK